MIKQTETKHLNKGDIYSTDYLHEWLSLGGGNWWEKYDFQEGKVIIRKTTIITVTLEVPDDK